MAQVHANPGSCPGWQPVAAPTWLHDRLLRDLVRAPDGPLRTLHAGPSARYVEVPGRDGPWALGLLHAEAVPLPCGALVTDRSAGSVGVRAGRLRIDGLPVRVTRLIDHRVPRLTGATGDECGATAQELAARIGRGAGLTPYDDDVLCGWLATHRAYGVATPVADRAVLDRLTRTTTLSATLIRAALDGQATPAFGRFLTDPSTGATELARVGASSGRGMIEGARRALERLRVREAA